MNIIHAILLGLIQGLSEFLPISSTAHLTLAGSLMGLVNNSEPERWTAFIATIQLGTMLAVIIYFYKELYEIPTAFFSDNFGKNRKMLNSQSNPSRLGWLIIIGTIPVVIVGIGLKKIIEGNLTKDPIIIACSLIILAIILFIAEKTAKFKKDMSKITIFDGFIIGIAQCLALIPGASRSGTTITAGLFLGINRESAARFSFLLSIPAVLASGLLEFYKSLHYIQPADFINILIATIVAALSGLAAIHYLLKFLKTKTTMIFVYYRIILGLLIFWLVSRGIF